MAVIPNVAFYKTRWMLLQGKWDYADQGILDRTHLRFFTRSSAGEFFRREGFRVIDFSATHYSRRFSFLYNRLARWHPALFGEQFVIRAIRDHPP